VLHVLRGNWIDSYDGCLLVDGLLDLRLPLLDQLSQPGEFGLEIRLWQRQGWQPGGPGWRRSSVIAPDFLQHTEGLLLSRKSGVAVGLK
jgi:hypothetical protein